MLWARPTPWKIKAGHFDLQDSAYVRRGLAYACAHCDYVGQKMPARFHVLKDHLKLSEVPFYCSLCYYKAFTKQQLEKHVTQFPMHMRLRVTKGAGRKDEEYFVANQSPREILIGLDLIPQEGQASQQVWKSRQRKPQSQPQPQGELTAAALLQSLQGRISKSILDQAIEQCGIPTSPTFSQASFPDIELGDPVDMDLNMTVTVSQPIEKPLNSMEPAFLGMYPSPPTSTVEPSPATSDSTPLPTLVTSTVGISIPPTSATLISTLSPSTVSTSTSSALATSTPIPASTPSPIPCASTSIKSPSYNQYYCPTPTSIASYSTIKPTRLEAETQTETVAKPAFTNVATQTDSLDTIVKDSMREMMADSFQVFAQVLGEKFAQYHPTEALQGIQSALDCHNQNILQLAQVIENQVNECRKQHVKLGENPLASAITTLVASVNDLRTDFRSYAERPASESQHQRTSQALQSVVTGINTLMAKLLHQPSQSQPTQQMPRPTQPAPQTSKSTPQPPITGYEATEFDRLVSQVLDDHPPKQVKTLEQRRAERMAMSEKKKEEDKKTLKEKNEAEKREVGDKKKIKEKKEEEKKKEEDKKTLKEKNEMEKREVGDKKKIKEKKEGERKESKVKKAKEKKDEEKENEDTKKDEKKVKRKHKDDNNQGRANEISEMPPAKKSKEEWIFKIN